MNLKNQYTELERKMKKMKAKLGTVKQTFTS